MIEVSAALGALALLVAALLPAGAPRRDAVGRGLGALAAVALLPGVSEPGALIAVVAAVGAAAVGTPLALVLAAAAAARVALGVPTGAAPLASACAALGAVAAADGLLVTWRERPPERRSPAAPLLVTGALLVGVLATVDQGAVLGGGFRAAGAPPWIGPLLSGALVCGLGGVLLVAGGGLTTEAPAARPMGCTALAAAAAFGILGALVTTAHAVLVGAVAGDGGGAVAALLAASGALAVAWQERDRAGQAGLPTTRAALGTKVATALAMVAVAAAGLAGWWREGTHATPLTGEAASAALLGLAALVPTRGAIVLRVVLLLALVLVVVS